MKIIFYAHSIIFLIVFFIIFTSILEYKENIKIGELKVEQKIQEDLGKEKLPEVKSEPEKVKEQKIDKSKTEIIKLGAIELVKIPIHDLELTEEEYLIKKTELIDKYKTERLEPTDANYFIAVLNREIDLWKTANKKDFVVSNFKNIDDIIAKLNL